MVRQFWAQWWDVRSIKRWLLQDIAIFSFRTWARRRGGSPCILVDLRGAQAWTGSLVRQGCQSEAWSEDDEARKLTLMNIHRNAAVLVLQGLRPGDEDLGIECNLYRALRP